MYNRELHRLVKKWDQYQIEAEYIEANWKAPAPMQPLWHNRKVETLMLTHA